MNSVRREAIRIRVQTNISPVRSAPYRARHGMISGLSTTGIFGAKSAALRQARDRMP
jgi:hypothetical protein